MNRYEVAITATINAATYEDAVTFLMRSLAADQRIKFTAIARTTLLQDQP